MFIGAEIPLTVCFNHAQASLPPGGLAANLDEVIKRRVAQETIQTFTNHIGIAVMCPAARNPGHSEGASPPANGGGGSWTHQHTSLRRRTA
jgi:hypothetical protein